MYFYKPFTTTYEITEIAKDNTTILCVDKFCSAQIQLNFGFFYVTKRAVIEWGLVRVGVAN